MAFTETGIICRCGHCTRMKPDWDRLAEESPADVVIADVDCGKEEDVSVIQVLV